ncbi:hypothetical protein GETHLI_10830 [Geothrix limicola]|uniref:Uncharacterized protein n=1 Tax=Geothrix limicola TaxID=2927978 RepID=A0ABQ5QE22_9BACT|nr:hypothetical protein [Geothrix limicola]GLH72581.1 hypothetical protein GETHLI_10830 [Geothrix limicola]
MKVWARINHVGWVHLWLRREDFEAAEPSAHFLNGRSDPRWLETELTPGQRAQLQAGELVEIEDPGYFPDET